MPAIAMQFMSTKEVYLFQKPGIPSAYEWYTVESLIMNHHFAKSLIGLASPRTSDGKEPFIADYDFLIFTI